MSGDPGDVLPVEHDRAFARARNIPVCNAPGKNADAVAQAVSADQAAIEAAFRFSHGHRVRYDEIDAQGVVGNATWLNLLQLGRMLVRGASVPGCGRLLSYAGPLVFRPARGDRLTATNAPGVRDLVRHAVIDLGGNANRARSWAKAARRWPGGAQRDLLEAYPAMDFPVLLLWADSDAAHPLEIAEEALEELPDGQLRILPRTGFLIAYDDPVGLARELVAFCG